MLNYLSLAKHQVAQRRSLMTIISERAAPGCINFGLGEPTDPAPPKLRRIISMLAAEDSADYGPAAGLSSFRAKIAQQYKTSRFGAASEPECVVATCGTTHAIYIALATCLEAGGEVIYPDPGYVLYEPAIRLCGGIPVPLQLNREAGFALDPDRLQQMLTNNTKAVIINSPANPTGRVIPPDDLTKIAAVCDARGIQIISDEVYEHLVYEGRHRSIAEFSENVIVCSGISKLFRFAGWRLGWCIASRELASRLLIHHQYSVFRAPTISQRIAETVLGMPAEIEQVRQATRRRRDLMTGMLREIPSLTFTEPEGGLFVYADVSVFGSDWDVALRLLNNGVISVPSTGPGVGFGSGGAGLLRLSFACDEQSIREGVDRIKSTLSSSS